MYTLKNDLEKHLYDLHMQRYEELYDPEARMITGYRGPNGYHSKLKNCTVHEIRGSFEYAWDLLMRDEPGDRERAYDILYRVIPLQEQNPARNTFGIWSYFLEERLEEMDMPDWNWADFNGKTLLRILLFCAHTVNEDLRSLMEKAILNACEAIIRRNMGPHYTNISVMGSYVTLVAGELLNKPEIFAYGKKRLQDLYAYNVNNGSFSEFNSPTYTFVVLRDLADLEQEVQDPECAALAHQLSDMAWETIALHYHPATGQLAGPHDRAYSMLLAPGTKLSVERALDYRFRLIDDHGIFTPENIGNEVFCHQLHCPEKYLPYFTEASQERVIDQTFAPGRMAYTYLTEKFTLGSLHREIAWNQHRNVLGYFGTVEAPVGLCLRCHHDGWDYSSGLMASVQDKGRVLSLVNFHTNGGDTHCNLDMVKNATITARDFRIRYVFGGAVDTLKVIQDGSNFRISAPGMEIAIRFPYVEFDGRPISFEVVQENGEVSVDAVLYHGEESSLNFANMEKAAAAVLLEMSTEEIQPSPCEISEQDGVLNAAWGNLTAALPLKPCTVEENREAIHLTRDGKTYEPAF